MIARLWRGVAAADQGADYARHFAATVTPALAAVPGSHGAYLLRRETAGRVEFLTITLWDSIETIRGFAGDPVDAAVVEPAARAALLEFDAFPRHYEVRQAPG